MAVARYAVYKAMQSKFIVSQTAACWGGVFVYIIIVTAEPLEYKINK